MMKHIKRITYKHHLASMLLAMGMEKGRVAEHCGMTRVTLWKWEKAIDFQILVTQYGAIFSEVAKNKYIDEVEFLKKTVNDARDVKVFRSDGIKAAELLLKIQGRVENKIVFREEGAKKIEDFSDEELEEAASRLIEEAKDYLSSDGNKSSNSRAESKKTNKRKSK